VNLVRLVAWYGDPTHSQVQPSRFVALATAYELASNTMMSRHVATCSDM
jgi:hypothetical protein